MKFAESLFVLVALLATASAHMAMLYPTPRGGFGTKQYNGRVHSFIGYKDSTWNMRFPCGGYAPGPVTNLVAGQTVNVRFYASGMKDKDIKTQPKLTKSTRQFAQARHGGGLCEFSLSYDGGKSYHLIGSYSRTCPDAYYQWPVKIPANIPSCTTKNKCLFVWTWTANTLPQYYQNCADIRLTGGNGKAKLNKKGIQIHDFAPYKQGVVAPGDGTKHNAGPGPIKAQIKANLIGQFHI
ncbi:hypothetical protein BGZ76_010582 [Entomortierella beljakovae]|nr:hypothetical protein BGZ76_010582 [Entomortierella beljakovae]